MDYRSINQDLWDKWTKLHLETAMYDMAAFRNGRSSLIGPELDILGDLTGKRVLHLQCHFGQDSLSMARMGASVVGVDMSEEAVRTGNSLAEELGLDAAFKVADVMELGNLLNEQFDIVFTSYGVLIWLPNLDKWAATVARHLKPGGRFIIVEFHPFLNVFEDSSEELKYSYFREEAIVESEEGSYADPEARHVKGRSMTWDFSISEVVNPLMDHGLKLLRLEEYNYSPYDIYTNSIKTDKGFQDGRFKGKVPYIFSLEMVRT